MPRNAEELTRPPPRIRDGVAVHLRVDLHAHTRHSLDATLTAADLVERALEVGLDRIAVTDHGELDGALEARELAPDLVIVGEEIRCRCRTEVIGLYLRERVPQRLSVEETVERIRDQGGIVYAPHPYAYAVRGGERARRALAAADIVEAVNARAFIPAWNREARRAADRHSLGIGAGSDAHFPSELGNAWAELPAFDGPAGLVEAARHGEAVWRGTTGPVGHALSAGLKALRLAGRVLTPAYVGEPVMLPAER